MAKKLKNLNPQPFPKGDKNYIDKFYLNKDNVHHYLYHNAKGEVLFLVYIQDKEDGSKSVQHKKWQAVVRRKKITKVIYLFLSEYWNINL